jgi:hypothetical protein
VPDPTICSCESVSSSALAAKGRRTTLQSLAAALRGASGLQGVAALGHLNREKARAENQRRKKGRRGPHGIIEPGDSPRRTSTGR